MLTDDDVYYYMRWRLKLEGETENMGVCTKERKGITAAVLMAAPCTNSLGGESGGQKHEGREGRSACWKYAAAMMRMIEIPTLFLPIFLIHCSKQKKFIDLPLQEQGRRRWRRPCPRAHAVPNS